MTPENHTLFDWNTLDEYSDLQRLQSHAQIRQSGPNCRIWAP